MKIAPLFKTWFGKKTKIIELPVHIYEQGKAFDDSKPILFQNEREVEIFKLEEEVRECDRRIEEINSRLKPWEDEIRKRHRDLWGY